MSQIIGRTDKERQAEWEKELSEREYEQSYSRYTRDW